MFCPRHVISPCRESREKETPIAMLELERYMHIFCLTLNTRLFKEIRVYQLIKFSVNNCLIYDLESLLNILWVWDVLYESKSKIYTL